MGVTQPKNRKAIWGWYFYDWAAQPYHTLLITFIFAPYFTSAVAENPVEGQILWGRMMALVGIFLAIAAPILGALADATGPRKPWVLILSALYVFGAFSLWYAVPDAQNITFILWAFAIGLIGVELAQIFVNAMLPTLAPRSELGRISGSGWAFGYWGGVVALFIMLLFLAENEEGVTLLGAAPLFGLDPEMREGTRAVGPMTAIWFAIFVIPFFLFVPDIKPIKSTKGAVAKSLRELVATLKKLPENISFAAYLEPPQKV